MSARPPRRRRSPRAQLCPLPRLLPGRHCPQRRRHRGQPALHPAGDRQAGRRLPTILLDDEDGVSTPSSTGGANVTLYSDLVAGVQEMEYRRPLTRQSDTAALFYSSGMTGESKGVVLTHDNFIAAATMVTSDQDARVEGCHVFLCFLPMSHIFGMSVVTLGQLQRGNTVVVMSRFDMEDVMAAVQRHRVTYLFCVPPLMTALAKHRRGRTPLGKDVMEAVANNLPDAEIVQVR